MYITLCVLIILSFQVYFISYWLLSMISLFHTINFINISFKFYKRKRSAKVFIKEIRHVMYNRVHLLPLKSENF